MTKTKSTSAKKVLLLLSGGKDSPEALRRLQAQGHDVHGLCIDGRQGKEKVGAQKAADLYQIPLTVENIAWFDEETWNPFLLVKRDIAMAATAIRVARQVGATAVATGVKRTDIENPVLWWLGPFLFVLGLMGRMIGLELMYPVWNWGAQPLTARWKGVVRSVRRGFYSLLARTPDNWRHAMYRRLLLNLPKREVFGALRFEIAKTQSDLEQAFALLHDAYVERGFMKPHESGLRILMQNALPTTTTLVAKDGDKVVGTVALIRDNPLALPMEKAFSLHKLREGGSRLVEVSSLAVHPDWRRERGGGVLFPLLIFAYEYCRSYFGADYMVMNVYPHHADFYIGLFGATYWSGEDNSRTVRDYMGAPATSVIIHLRRAYDFVLSHYNDRFRRSNLRHFIQNEIHTNFIFPDRNLGQVNDPVMTPELLNYFFRQKQDFLSHASPQEVLALHRYYRGRAYRFVLPPMPSHMDYGREHERFDSRFTADGRAGGQRAIAMKILDASLNGFRAHLSQPIRFGETLHIEIANENSRLSVRLQAQPVWNAPNEVYGFRIHSAPAEWRQVVEALADSAVTKARTG